MRVFLVVLLATGALAAPFSVRKEKPPSCDKRLDRFHHAREFPYNYEGETISSVAGASSARSGLKIRARCVIKAVEPCLHVLRIDTTELWEAQSKNPGPLEYHVSQGSPAFAEELQAHDLIFRTARGRVTEVLSNPEEPSHVLNIKRGILSAMQVQFVNQHAVLEEDDVVGRCQAQYHIKSRHLNGRPKVVYKSRNLTDCTDHAKTDLGIHVHSYDEKPVSLLKSQSTCKLYLTAKNRAQKVVCEEQHIFRPFSAGHQNASGAITTTRQVLDLQPIRRAKPVEVAVDELQPVSLKYEHSKPQSNQEAINEAFSDITRLSRESLKETKPDSAQHFSKVVFGIRKLNTEAMQTLWEKIHNEDDEKVREYLYDALPHCGTGGCAKVMSHAVKNNLVSNERGNMFLAGLAMAGNPTEDTIGHVLELCEANPGRIAMLTLGTLLHKFCESSPRKCEVEDPESPIVRSEMFLKSRLGSKCDAKTPEEFEDILLTLKAIGNAGRPVSAEKTLFKCAINPSAPINMSIAALESLRRMPCSDRMTNQLLEVYGEFNLDVEIRIAAYLALMKCPTPEVFKRVASILKNEVNNQVGSFVWSHMTNAMESTEPVHGQPQAEMMRDALSGMKLREFNLNRLRFSRAWEGSFYSDILRFGGSAQSHLIYHPDSYFPRSAMVNLTVDVLGASINVLETAARFEGFETLIEQFFGDEGYYPDDNIMKMFNLKPHEERDNVEKKVDSKVRGRRSISDDVNRVEKHLNKLHRTMDSRKHHPSGAVSVKMFGNEMRLAIFDDISWLNDEVDNVNMVDILLKLAQGGKQSYTKSLMFLDAETTVPTILGLPLKLSAKGTTVASVELDGKFDIRNMFWGKMSFDVRGYVKPSAVVDISGRMGVSAIYAEAGVLVNSSLYTATQIKGNATYSQGETLKFELGVPEDPVQFINISSSLFTTLNDKKIAIKGTPRRIEPSPCLNMTRVLGITFCSQLSLPLGYRDYESPFFPFSGPASFSVSMQRTDPKLTKYQLVAERLETEDENKYDVVAKMSTPGATWERNFEANGTLWFQKDGKLFQMSTGALGYNFGKFEATYNNISHALNLTFSAKDAVYGQPIMLNGQFFNNSKTASRELGIEMSATYKNYTISQLTKFYNKSHVYGFVSNTTYWPNKYLYSAGELNVPDRSINFIANHTCSKTEVRFNGKLGKEENNFVFGFTNKPTKLGVDITGRHMKSQNEGSLHMFLRPFEQSFTLRGSYLKSGDEKGVRFTASHDNENRVVNWYAGIVNATKEKSFKANATILGRKAQAMWTYFNYTQEKGIKFNGLLLNKTIDSVWSYVNVGEQKGLKFKASGLNKTMQAAWTLFNLTNEKSLKFNGTFLNKTAEAIWSYVNFGAEKGLRFNASVMNKTAEAIWSYVNFGQEKGLRFNATVMNETAEAVWSYFNLTNEKGLRFNASALNKKVEAVWSYVNFGSEKGLRFNASALNKTVEAVWSYVNFGSEKGLRFNASALNKTVEAVWSYFSLGQEKGLKFNASALNKTIQSSLTFLNFTQEKSIRLNMAGLNKTLEAAWSYISLENEKALCFNASALNRTIAAMWSYINLGQEKGIRFNASAMNRTIEAAWTFLNLTTEKSLQFKARVMNKTVVSALTFVSLANEKSIKFNATCSSNRTVEAAWTFASFPNEKLVKFNATAMNKSVEAVWSYLTSKHEKSIKFHASGMNRTMESTLTFFNLTSEKGLKFNMAVMNKTMNASLVYFKHLADAGLRLNVTCCNKSIELVSKVLFQEKERKLVFSAAYQNYTVALVGLFQNLTTQKTACMYPEYLGRTHGKICAVFTNSSAEKSMALNMTILNRTGELKSTWFKTPIMCANRITAKCNSTTFFESWLRLSHKPELKSLHMNVTVVNKSAGATFFFQNETEKAVGLNVTFLNKEMGVKGIWFNEKSLKEAAVFLVWNKTIIATSSVKLVDNTNRKMLEFRARVGRYVAELQNVYVAEKEGRREFIMVRMLRNGSQSMFFDSSNLIYSRKDKSHELAYSYNLEVMGRSFHYGWDVSYNNFSNAEDSYHETKFSLMYSKGKKVSLTSIYRNTSEELSSTVVVEYLPEKTMQHSLTWYKQRNTVDLKWELLPRMPMHWKIYWTKHNGFSLNSVFTFFNKKIENWFEFASSTGDYDGHFEICPYYPLTVKGQVTKENGFLFTTEIGALKKTWNHRIEFDREEQRLQVAVDVLPQAPVVFEATWDMEEGLQITTDLKGFEKSLHWEGVYDKLTKTFTSDLTVLKQKLTFTEQLDAETKTLILTVTAFNRTAGFSGRFDWKTYVVSSYLSYQKHTAGWFLRFNPASRSIVFNVTATPTLSGQVVADMPDDSRLQVTLQRKFGVNVVNESRLTYHLNPKASSISLTWNTTTINTLVKRVESLKTLLKNLTSTYYNLTAEKARNLTLEVDILVKKLRDNIRPHAMKLYAQVKSYDYKGLMVNTSKIAQNMTYQAYRKAYTFALKALNDTIENLPMLVRNATELYKKIRQNATDVYKRFRSEVLPPIVGNVTHHVKNISRDLQLWANNVTIMMSGVTVRGEKIGDIAKRVSLKVKEMTKELVKKVELKTQEMIVKVREIEIRKQKLGPLYDKYMMQVVEFTCGFNASCTYKNITIIARNLTLRVRNLTVLNKTVDQHFTILKTKTIELHQRACNFTRNMTRALPIFLRNVSIQAIHLVRNLTKEVRIITIKTMTVTTEAYEKMMKTHRPLVKLVTNVFVSLKRRATPLVLQVIRPVVKFGEDLTSNVTIYMEPIVRPLVPMAFDVMYQVRNITIYRVPIGHAFDQAIDISLSTAVEAFKTVNHSLSSNISAAVAFIRENAQKTPEEIVDLTIKKTIEFFNLSKKAFNQSVELSFTLTRRAVLVYKKSIAALNKTLGEVLLMRPDEIVELSIRKIQVLSRNITAEVLTVTKQLRALDLVRPVKTAWVEMDLKAKFDALDLDFTTLKNLKAKWENVLQRIRAFNIKEKALLIRYRIGNATLQMLKELQDITDLTYRVANLTRSLVRMKISKEDFVEEFIAIGQEGRRVFLKYAFLFKNTSYDLQNKLRNSSMELADRYKNMTVEKSLEVYDFLKKHSLSFYNEHREEGLVVYNMYKDIVMNIYEELKEKAMEKVNVARSKLMKEVETLVAKVRQYENMTYEEIVTKVYELTSRHGLALYKNVSMRAMKFFNDTKNATLRAYNLTMVLANRTQLMARQYYNMTRNYTLHYYNMTQKYSLQYYNLTRNATLKYYLLTRNATLKYYKQYYNLTRNYTLRAYNETRNWTLHTYNKTRAMALRGMRYVNVSVVPRVKEYYVKGKVMLESYVNKTVIFVKKSVNAVKVWYDENKEKTVEELYFEVYGLAERKFNETKDMIKVKVEEVRGKLKIRMEELKKELQKELQKLNKTVMNITGEVISVYNQTVNITLVAFKDLVAIFSPCVKIIHNKTVYYLVKVKNFSLPLIEMARTTTLKNLNETRELVSESYKKFMARKDVQEFIEKHQFKERYAKAERYVREQYQKVVEFIEETKPKVEAKLKEVIFYVNVTLPNEIKERYTLMKERYTVMRQKYDRIMANPKAYVDRFSKKGLRKVKKAFKNTPIEEIFMHEIWSDFVEEARQHELVEVGQDVMNFTATRLRIAAKVVSKNVKMMVAKAQRKVQKMVKKMKDKVRETREKMMEKFEEFKGMKLREIVEHNYVFKTIDMAKNITLKVKNITAEARNLTRKWLAVGKVFYKNFTMKVQNYTLLLKTHYNRLYQKHIIPLYKNYTVLVQKYTVLAQKYKVIAKDYVRLAKNMTLRGINITRNWTVAQINMTRMWINKTVEQGLKYYREEIVPLYNNKVLPLYYKKVLPFYNQKVLPLYYQRMLPFYTEKLVPMYHNYSRMLTEMKKNVTEGAMKMRLRAIELTQRAINMTLASKQYALFRQFGRMTIRDSVLEGYALCHRACNYTLNMTRLAYNLTLKRINTTRAYLNHVMNVTKFKAGPMMVLMNATRNEIMETAVFVNNYYGIEKAVRERVRRSLDITRNVTMQVVNHHGPQFLQTSALKTLDFVNKTIRYVNRTIDHLNVTLRNISRRVAVKVQNITLTIKTKIHNVRITINKTLNDIRIALPKYIQVKEGSVTVIIPHPRPVSGNIKTLALESVEKVKDMKRRAVQKVKDLKLQALEKVEQLKWQAKEKMENLKEQARNLTHRVKTLSKAWVAIADNKTLLYRQKSFRFATKVYNMAKMHPVTGRYLNMTIEYYHITEDFVRALNLTQIKNQIENVTRKYLLTALNVSRQYLNVSRQYYTFGLNTTRNFTLQVYKVAVNVTLDIYNSSCLGEALNKSKIYSKMALNGTLKLYRQLYNTTMMKKYLPMALNKSRQWYINGFNATRNFTVRVYRIAVNATRTYSLKVYRIAVNVSLDIYHSKNLREALGKAKNYSRKAFNETMILYRKMYKITLEKYLELYNRTMVKYAELYNLTMEKYEELYNRSLELYKRIAEHETTVKYMNHARTYLEHSKKMMKMRVRHLHSVKRYWQKRVTHKVSQMSRLLNPVNWIPPFNSTAMIFGGPHVYTFDKTYYTFPGYKKADCMYVLARDVRDNKFTILSQETAIIVITEDSSVKIHQDGRVESITKITTSGKKITDGYDSELPVEMLNTTVTRDGSFVYYRHDLGLEIVCDVEHYLCSFNIAKWYHGRMAGLLGTNNNEFHDEMMTSYNTPAEKLIDFINSWEVTHDPECLITKIDEDKPKCTETSYIQRCRTLFKDKESPLSRFASVVNPEPFVEACELDYKDCESSTPKDMKHCNTTAAYIELVRMEGEWADYLPECGRCGSNQIGQRWFQKSDKMVDVVILVHETSVLKSYAEKIPTFLTSLTEALDKYSFRFGVVGYGGESIHARPHTVTVDGQLMNDLSSVDRAIEHLKFTGSMENDTADALEAVVLATRAYTFRPGATKIFLLLPSAERTMDTISLNRVTRMLDASDITLNVIGKYRKFRGEIVGQDYRGKVFYRKKPEIGTGVVDLPEGEYVALMKSTQGSVFGLPFLGSEKKDRFGALQQASISTWKEQIKRDQYTCKECFCARGDAGQGKTICKNNALHNKC